MGYCICGDPVDCLVDHVLSFSKSGTRPMPRCLINFASTRCPLWCASLHPYCSRPCISPWICCRGSLRFQSCLLLMMRNFSSQWFHSPRGLKHLLASSALLTLNPNPSFKTLVKVKFSARTTVSGFEKLKLSNEVIIVGNCHRDNRWQ